MTYLFVPVKSKISCDLVYCSVIFGLVVTVNFIHVVDQFCLISGTDVVLLCSSMRIGHVTWIVLENYAAQNIQNLTSGDTFVETWTVEISELCMISNT